jgi:hypothetical protein
VRALRGVEEGFGRAQLIVLTRLVRAATAIVILDTIAKAPAAENGRTSRRGPAG